MLTVDLTTHLLGPRDVHRVSSPDAYRACQAAYIAAVKARVPHHPAYVHRAIVAPREGPLVEWGAWKIACGECGNWPSFDPEWRLACCLECGAIYEDLTVDGEVHAIATSLLVRPVLALRNWP